MNDPKPLEGERILILDINEFTADYHRDICLELGAQEVIIVDNLIDFRNYHDCGTRFDLVIIDRGLPSMAVDAQKVKGLIAESVSKYSQSQKIVRQVNNEPDTEKCRTLTDEYFNIENEHKALIQQIRGMLVRPSLIGLVKDLYAAVAKQAVPWVFLEAESSEFEEASQFASHLLGLQFMGFMRYWDEHLYERLNPANYDLLAKAGDSALNEKHYRPKFEQMVTRLLTK